MNFEDLEELLREFAARREWDKFHSPKNLSMALSVEAAELLEHFQWLTQQESTDLPQETLAKVAEEIADIQIYLIRLADKLDVDLEDAVTQKIKKNEEKYPADKVKGSAVKYTAYQQKK